MPGLRKRIASMLRVQYLAAITATVIGACTACVQAHATSLGAPYSFGEQLAPGERVSSLVTADVDGDGIPELIGSEQEANRIVVWVPDGSGGIRIKSTIACLHPGQLIASDFNADGRVDIAALSPPQTCAPCDQSPAGLTIFRGLAGGVFQAFQAFQGGSWRILVAGDFNGDQLPDLVVGSNNDTLLLVMNSSLGFENPTPRALPGTQSTATLVSGDIDGDGFDDLLVWSYEGFPPAAPKTLLFPGNPSGLVGNPASLPFDMLDGQGVLADLDRDGALDLVLPSHTGRFDIFWNTGHALSDVPDEIPGTTQPSSERNLMAVADLDGDGRDDLIGVTRETASDRLVIEWNMGMRNWEQAGILIGDNSSHRSPALAAYDFDRDGLLDIVDTHEYGYEGDGGAELLGFRHLAARSFAAIEEYMVAGIISARPIVLPDGRPAILISGADSTRIMIARPDGSFEPAVAYSNSSADGAFGIDWNGDGCSDLAFPQGDVLKIEYCAGGSTSIPPLPAEQLIGHGDFNGDQLDDLLVGTVGPGLMISFRDSDRGFLPPTSISADSDLPRPDSPVVVGDFNEDGLADMAAAYRGFSTDSLIVYRNDGNSTFTRTGEGVLPPAQAGPDTRSPGPPLAMDVDGDHHLDIAYFGRYGDAGNVRIGHGVGNGTFAWDTDYYYIPSEFPWFCLLDLTGDGFPDIASQSAHNGTGIATFSFRANLGNGRFEEPGLSHFVGAYPSRPSFGDLNGDGRLDVVTTSNGYYPFDRGNIRILLNTGRDFATPVSLSPVRAIFEGALARVEWRSDARTQISGTVMRSDDDGGWREVGAAWSDGSGLVAFTDAGVRAGTHYSYRLDYFAAGTAQQTAAIELYVPAAALALSPSQGNPVRGRLQLSCVLPSDSPAMLDLFDITGRRVDSVPIKRAASGATVGALNVEARLAAGVYWARLTQGHQSVSARMVLLR